MKTQWTLRVRLCALAAAGLALTGVSTAVRADDSATAQPLAAVSSAGTLMGPGLWSVKSPFWGQFQNGSSFNGSGSSDKAMLFHTSDQQAVQQVPIQRLGPGPWSVKSPFSGSYQINGSYQSGAF